MSRAGRVLPLACLPATALIIHAGCFLGCGIESHGLAGGDGDAGDPREDAVEAGLDGEARDQGEADDSRDSLGEGIETVDMIDVTCEAPTENPAWIAVLKGGDTVFLSDVVENDCGEIIVSGYVVHGEGDSIDLLIAKLSHKGDILWQKTMGGDLDEYGRTVGMGGSGEIVVTGDVSAGELGSLVIEIRLDTLGGILGQHVIDPKPGNSLYCYRMVTTGDGRRVLLGDTDAPLAGAYDSWVAMIDADGSFLWQQIIGDYSSGGSYLGHGHGVALTRSGGVIMTGWRGGHTDENDMWVVSMDSSGIIQWQNRLGPAKGDEATAALETDDGDILVAGGLGVFITSEDEYDIYLVKLTSYGALIGVTALDHDKLDVAANLIRTSDGQILLAGWSGSEEGGGTDAFLLKLDSENNVVWQKIYRLPGFDLLRSVIESRDGGLIFVGSTGAGELFGQEHSGLIVKVDADGEIPGSCNAVEEAVFEVVDFPITMVSSALFRMPTGFSMIDEGLPEAGSNLVSSFSCFEE